jgi:hypothetical protein
MWAYFLEAPAMTYLETYRKLFLDIYWGIEMVVQNPNGFINIHIKCLKKD